MSVQQKSFQIGSLSLVAQSWRLESCSKATPVLALHGWLDNSASFELLADQLKAPLMALDLAGHGQSSHRSSDSSYNLWLDVDEVLQVANQLGWKQFSLLGHSRGAMISVLLAAVAPERVAKVALIDGLVPFPVPEDQVVDQLRRAIQEKHRFAQRKRRRYPTFKEIAETRLKGDFPLSENSAMLMAKRGTQEDENGFYWSADPRLQAASEVKFTEGQLRSFLTSIQAPVQLYLARRGMGRLIERFAAMWQLVERGERIDLEGGHHLHMDGATGEIAESLNRFF
ncbi:alpha/beta fold hydrolase [Porticoccaceae bacterium LTM1]|nr:alpha/beta fold hydrolase [Porticoccaceae bacterium LTM1]